MTDPRGVVHVTHGHKFDFHECSMSININSEIVVWCVTGLYNQVWPSKEAAYLAAHARWPDEPEGVRYSRLYPRRARLSF